MQPYQMPWKLLCGSLQSLMLATLLCSGCASTARHPQSALDELHNRIEQDAGNTALYLELASAYLQRQEYLRAKQYHALGERVYQMNLSNGGREDRPLAERLFKLGVAISTRSQQYSDAIARCESLLRLRDDKQVRELLAALYGAIGDTAASERQRKILLQQNPEDRRYVLELARFYDQGDDLRKRELAPPLYQRYLEMETDPEAASAVRARLLEHRITASDNREVQP